MPAGFSATFLPPKKTKPTIRPIQVFKQFDPEDYLEYCQEEGETPTQEGFREFLGNEIPKDFEILDNS